MFKETVTVARALIRRGVKGSVAKNVTERLSEGLPALVEVPHFESELEQELQALGVSVAEPRHARGEDLAKLRQELSLSQEQFANSLGLDVRTMQNWEQGRVSLEGAVGLLIKVIERFPEAVQRVAADDTECVLSGPGRRS